MLDIFSAQFIGGTSLRNSKITKNKILISAEKIFAEKGYHGASVNEIAADADVNKRMIYVYFGNKETLYITVLKIVFDRLAQIDKKISTAIPPEQAIEDFIFVYFKFLSENENFVRLFMWENLNKAELIKLSVESIKRDSDLLLKQIIQNGIESGIFKKEIDVNEIILAINMFVFSYFTSTYISNYINTKKNIPKRAKMVSEMILSYIKI